MLGVKPARLVICAFLGLMTGQFSAHAELRKFDITIEEVEIEVAPGFKSKVWAYNGQVPGPLLHVKEGDEVEITLINNTTLNHTIHWHGTYQTGTWTMDGVPDITQKAIDPGESFVYRFTADKPGSLWYHCHVNVPEHVGLRGMWGAMIVDPREPTELEKQVTKEAVLMFSGWNSEVAMTYGQGGHPTEKKDYFSINGRAFPMTQPLRVKKDDVLRLRLYGAGTDVAFHLHGHDMLVTHKDGLPLKSPYWADVIDIAEGARIDAIVKMDNPGLWINHDHIDHHVSNNGKTPGGAVMIVEYEDIEKPDWYVWKNKPYDPDFYMSESLKKGYGLFNIDAFKGTFEEPVRRKKKRKKSD
ncbi:multicopper oxidase domain-containing protein [Emcibacter sp.]|uniref:multicopper oxidase domain-containing protein n=1 Tax=Emcibacter sp. TaxID=1979954 RepID=UPI003A93DCDB